MHTHTCPSINVTIYTNTDTRVCIYTNTYTHTDTHTCACISEINRGTKRYANTHPQQINPHMQCTHRNESCHARTIHVTHTYPSVLYLFINMHISTCTYVSINTYITYISGCMSPTHKEGVVDVLCLCMYILIDLYVHMYT